MPDTASSLKGRSVNARVKTTRREQCSTDRGGLTVLLCRY